MTPTAIRVIASNPSKKASHARPIFSPCGFARPLAAVSRLLPDSAHYKLRQYKQKRSARDGVIDILEPSIDFARRDLPGIARIPREARLQHRERATHRVRSGENLHLHFSKP